MEHDITNSHYYEGQFLVKLWDTVFMSFFFRNIIRRYLWTDPCDPYC